MGPWRSDFEFVIGDHQLDEGSPLDQRKGHWLTPGLFVRTSEGRVKARYNEWSPQSTSPTLRAELVRDRTGTRIVGSMSWAQLMWWPILWAFGAAVGVAGGTAALVDGEASAGLVLMLCGVCFSGFTIWDLKTESSQRSYEEQRLRDSLSLVFGAHSSRT